MPALPRKRRSPSLAKRGATKTEARAAAPPWWRDPWGWAAAASVLLPVAGSLGAPLGEPVAEDFDFIHHLLFSPDHSWLDGGGSTSFWRPVAQQLYYGLFARPMLEHPELIAGLHALLLALAAALFYRALRRAWPGPWAALAASFPMLSESSRQLVTWPGHSADLGAWLFTAIAVHEFAACRRWTTLAAVLAALLSKESAVVGALALPWLPRLGPAGWRARARWAAAIGVIVLAWGLAYLGVRARAGLALPHGLEATALSTGAPWIDHLGWALRNTLRATVSLPAVERPWEGWLWASLGLLALAAVALWALVPARRALIAASAPSAWWGAAWFFATAASLAPLHPLWAPNRALYGGLGLGVACSASLGALHPALPAALALIRLGGFAASPRPPATLDYEPPATGATVDFQKLARLQLLLREVRTGLVGRHPELPAGSWISQHHFPHQTSYALGGDRALQIWYRDTTLRWITWEAAGRTPGPRLVAVVEYQEVPERPIVLVPGEAVRALARASRHLSERRPDSALAALDRAERLGPADPAPVFRATVNGRRALCLAWLGRLAESEARAQESLAQWRDNPDAHMALALVWADRGRLDAAAAQIDTVLRIDPRYRGAAELRAMIRAGGARR